MAERSGFFDAHLVNGEYDRVYLAESFAKYFASFISNGVFGGKSSELMVHQKDTPDMSIKVLPGQGWINGYWYENDSELSLAIDVADGVLNRIDTVVLRWNNVERVIRLVVKKGTPASNPSAPIVQRDADYYELKLAQIYIKAGATRINQVDITDTRLNEDVCGIVVGVVQQLDTEEFGKQLGEFVEDFIAHAEDWFSEFENGSNSRVNTLLNESQARVDKFVSDNQTSINGVVTTGQQNIAKVVSDGTTNINKVVTDGQTAINGVVTKGTKDINDLLTTKGAAADNLISAKTAEIDEVISEGQQQFNEVLEGLEELAADNDLAGMRLELNGVKTDVTNIDGRVSNIEAKFIESTQYPGCYYRVSSGENEWINPPNDAAIEYRTTERWFGKPVYQKLLYVGVLPNKTMMAIEIGAVYRNIISISGFAVDADNNMYYPFPIILNGLTPIAIIQGAEGDGGDNSTIIIQTNDDLSNMYGCITVKYTKD